jgi:hypothetical protein
MAFTTGLLGAGHCIGMCGGIVAALSISGEGQRGGMMFHLLYNIGRTATYSLIGFLVGWLGSAIAYSDVFKEVSRVILVGSDIFIILVGLGTAGLFSFINVTKLDFPGPIKLLTVAVSRLRKLPPGIAALPIGLFMGFLPCGFLYAMAITAAQSADPIKGALVMLAFGLGTAPSLFLFGLVAHWLGTRARLWMMRGAGGMVALMGCFNLFKHLKMMGVL